MEEEERKPKAAWPGRPDLSPMSVEDLNDYIAELEAEIARVRADIERKETHRAGLDSLFKK
jgi:uncharacterized small protein (DUF1192 family)